MKDKFIVGISLIVAAAFLLFGDFTPEGRVYDCGMAEWHPDIPLEVKEECRKMKREFYEQEQQKKKVLST